jgi:diguanylate cyclase (GGDEF)-like protein/PAS domain S-box-containing protein
MGTLPESALTEKSGRRGFGHTVLFLANLPVQLCIFFCLLLCAIWAGIYFQLHSTYDQVVRTAERDRSNLARAFAEQVKSSVRGIDLSLLALREEWRRDPVHFHAAVQRQQSYFIRDVSFQIGVIDASGMLMYTNLDPHAAPVSLADREHFRVHRERGIDELFISNPLLGRVSNRWSIQFTRPIIDPEQGFAGVIVMSVSPDYFSRFYDSINLGEHGVVALVKMNGVVMARSPHPEQGLGKIFTDTPYLAPDAAETGSFRRKAQADGVNRIYTWRRLKDSGLVVVIGEPFDNMLASYQWQYRGYLIGGMMLSILLILFAFFTIAGLRHHARAISALAASEARSRLQVAALEAVGNAVFITDTQASIEWANPAFETVTGFTREEAIGKTPAILKSGRQGSDFYRNMWNSIEQDGHWQGEIWNRKKSGEIYPEWLVITAVKDGSGRTVHYVAAFSDITTRKEAEAQIRNLAFYDPLTALPNRRLLMDRIAQALAASGRSRQFGALMLLDLDHFKTLNDTLGHDVGDQLLVQVARRLKECVRECDTVARLGGDEFVVMLGGLDDDESAAAAQTETVAAKILTALNEPFALPGTYHCSASIGVSQFRDHDDPIDVLLKQADIALYQAKDAGRNTVRFYSVAMQAVLQKKAVVEAGLREALATNGFELYYQPQVDHMQQVIGAEALLRWRPPGRPMVQPGDFIPVAEETGLILPIGQWVLETACAQLAAWAKLPEMRDLALAINVSSRQFRQPGFVAQVAAALEASGADPTRLKLELTESMVLDDIEGTVSKMHALRDMGVRFALDDFGTGYSSLSYLKRLPLDQIKIDQSFVRDIATDPSDAAIVQTIISISHTLRLQVVAEGVEVIEQHAFLEANRCALFQGYLFGRPMALTDFECMLTASQESQLAGEESQ